MNEWVLIVGMALITFTIRYALFGMSRQIVLSPKLTHLLRYVPPSVLSAIVVTTVLVPENQDVGARCVGAIGYRTKNLLLTIGVGMLTFLLWQWIF